MLGQHAANETELRSKTLVSSPPSRFLTFSSNTDGCEKGDVDIFSLVNLDDFLQALDSSIHHTLVDLHVHNDSNNFEFFYFVVFGLLLYQVIQTLTSIAELIAVKQ
ncbi:hypothetical protein V8F06_011596 [Rhypophila decipiens]